MTTLSISPQGEYEIGIGTDADGETFVTIVLPDNRSGDVAKVTFMLPAFVSFADWVGMVAEKLVDEATGNPLPD